MPYTGLFVRNKGLSPICLLCLCVCIYFGLFKSYTPYFAYNYDIPTTKGEKCAMPVQNAPALDPFEDALLVVCMPSMLDFHEFEPQCHHPSYDDMWQQRNLTMQKKDAVETTLVKQRQLMFWKFSVLQKSILVWSGKLHRACLVEWTRYPVSRAISLLLLQCV